MSLYIAYAVANVLAFQRGKFIYKHTLEETIQLFGAHIMTDLL